MDTRCEFFFRCFILLVVLFFVFSLLCLAFLPRGYKTFFMLNSTEHEIFSANKYMKMPIIVGIFILISREIFMLSYV